MAKKVEKFIYSDTKEKLLNGISGFFLFLGVAAVIASFFLYSNSEDITWIFVGAGGVLCGLLISVILSSMGEIIKLLKVLIGLGFSGEISNTEMKRLECSGCGMYAIASETECSDCGAKFESSDSKEHESRESR